MELPAEGEMSREREDPEALFDELVRLTQPLTRQPRPELLRALARRAAHRAHQAGDFHVDDIADAVLDAILSACSAFEDYWVSYRPSADETRAHKIGAKPEAIRAARALTTQTVAGTPVTVEHRWTLRHWVPVMRFWYGEPAQDIHYEVDPETTNG